MFCSFHDSLCYGGLQIWHHGCWDVSVASSYESNSDTQSFVIVFFHFVVAEVIYGLDVPRLLLGCIHLPLSSLAFVHYALVSDVVHKDSACQVWDQCDWFPDFIGISCHPCHSTSLTAIAVSSNFMYHAANRASITWPVKRCCPGSLPRSFSRFMSIVFMALSYVDWSVNYFFHSDSSWAWVPEPPLAISECCLGAWLIWKISSEWCFRLPNLALYRVSSKWGYFDWHHFSDCMSNHVTGF